MFDEIFKCNNNYKKKYLKNIKNLETKISILQKLIKNKNIEINNLKSKNNKLQSKLTCYKDKYTNLKNNTTLSNETINNDNLNDNNCNNFCLNELPTYLYTLVKDFPTRL